VDSFSPFLSKSGSVFLFHTRVSVWVCVCAWVGVGVCGVLVSCGCTHSYVCVCVGRWGGDACNIANLAELYKPYRPPRVDQLLAARAARDSRKVAVERKQVPPRMTRQWRFSLLNLSTTRPSAYVAPAQYHIHVTVTRLLLFSCIALVELSLRCSCMIAHG